ncbi:hypothetical protein [Nostoc sp. ChiQUE01b]|uniref:hypothetical protein n=1 Tax=Nostoc sp. ChiQUE01b TaxID=3075376 RepID=UPI002AD391AC|nr:hypothetical protein [Nostoc sp. ChiQUE01b]MDZ8264142.1 hypothetical protein [Nostoc sp. ChiQUE01b]
MNIQNYLIRRHQFNKTKVARVKTNTIENTPHINNGVPIEAQPQIQGLEYSYKPILTTFALMTVPLLPTPNLYSDEPPTRIVALRIKGKNQPLTDDEKRELRDFYSGDNTQLEKKIYNQYQNQLIDQGFKTLRKVI